MLRIALGLLVLSLSASAATVNFQCLDNNSGTCGTNVAPYITASLNDLGGGQVQFLFSNSLPTAGRIREAFIDEGSNNFFSTFTITPTTGTSFVVFTSGTLPGGNGAPYSFTTDHGAGRTGGAANGVDPGETLDLRGTLNPGFTFANILSNLALGPLSTNSLRLGAHVQSLPGGFSEGLISNYDPPSQSPSPTPEPATFALVGVTLIGLVYLRQRKSANNE
jgi:hypothetical protein